MGKVHISAKELHVLNFIWFGCIVRLSRGQFWGQKSLGPLEIADYVFRPNKEEPPARLESAVH
jgi:hypothetical protein